MSRSEGSNLMKFLFFHNIMAFGYLPYEFYIFIAVATERVA